MALPDIRFNNTSGSDTAASGAGPGTAVSGSAAAHTNGSASTTITLTNTPDLSGVATDGSHALWLKTSGTTRRFSKITGKDDGADTVTVEDSFNIAAGSPVDYAIGGTRKTIQHADSVRLFIADAKAGWFITLEDDQPALTATITCLATGNTTTGMITLRGDSTTTRRLLTSATSNVSMLSGGLTYWRIQNLKFTSSAATKTSSYGIVMDASGGPFKVENCVFWDATNTLQRGIFRSGTFANAVTIHSCEVRNCIGIGLGPFHGGDPYTVVITDCFIHDNGGGGIIDLYGSLTGLIVMHSIISDNTGVGIEVSVAGYTSGAVIAHNTIHNNTSDGIKLTTATTNWFSHIFNNQITKNGGYGVNCATGTAALNDLLIGKADYNNTGTGALANTSGAYNALTAGSNDVQVDPSYTNATSDDYSIGDTTCKAGGYPDSGGVVGVGSATYSYVDIGAAQRQEPAGSTGGGGRAGTVYHPYGFA